MLSGGFIKERKNKKLKTELFIKKVENKNQKPKTKLFRKKSENKNQIYKSVFWFCFLLSFQKAWFLFLVLLSFIKPNKNQKPKTKLFIKTSENQNQKPDL